MKFFNFSRDIKSLKRFKDIDCNVAPGNTKYVWLVTPMKPRKVL